MKMIVIGKLSSSQGEKGEAHNLTLVQEIVQNNDLKSIKILITQINKQPQVIQYDIIKVLYEIGALNPSLISKYHKTFFQLLSHKSNRMIWGAMTAIDSITFNVPDIVESNLTLILETISKGSVITKDHGVIILVKLSSLPKFTQHVFPLLLEQLDTCPSKQLPMYAEKSLMAINSGNKAEFIKLLQKRYQELEKDTQRKRIDKIVLKLKSP